MPTPRLRDQYGQDWSFPPIEGPDQPGCDLTWLIFIPGAYTPVCMSELQEVSDLTHQLAEMHVGVRLIAPDSAAVLRLVADELDLQIPFLSDFWPHGAAANFYGILDESTGRPQRVSLLVDREGSVVEKIISRGGVRDMTEHLSVLQNKK